MSDVSINEYIRIGGRIDKIKSINIDTNTACGEKGNYMLDTIEDHSIKLINLVHLGDLVNGEIVIGINYIDGDDIDSVYTTRFIFNEDIETITGYEYIEAGEYKVKQVNVYEKN